MKNYIETRETLKLPRLPLEGNIDLTYRCNNNCRHCWLWLPPNAPEQNSAPSSGFILFRTQG